MIVFPFATLESTIEDLGSFVGETLIHQIYLDNGSLVTIFYSHCLAQLLETFTSFVGPATSAVVGFAGKAVCPEGKISFPFTLVDYQKDMEKTILADFIIIKASSPHNMLLGRTRSYQLQAVPSTVHGLLKFASEHNVITLRNIPMKHAE